jgi:hypothetical protein
MSAVRGAVPAVGCGVRGMCRVRASAMVKRAGNATIIDSMPFIANPAKTYVGTVRENAGAPSTSATQCPVIRAPKYILQTETEAWILADEQLAAKYAGKKVAVTGSVSDGNRLRATSIKAAH